MRYFIELAYDGNAYHGWQIQDGAASVQQIIEQSLKFKLGLQDHVTGCGRTDTGVHARQYFAHFDFSQEIESHQLEIFRYSINSFLPADISVRRIFRVKENVHARFDAISRTYKYYISPSKNPFLRNYSWQFHTHFDIDKMNQAAGILLKYTDFTSFSKLHTDVKTNNCEISEANWTENDDLLVFTITANRFLRNMVRAIVGTLTDVGRDKIPVENLHRIIQSKNRGNAGMSVPAKGLFLERVAYDWEKILV